MKLRTTEEAIEDEILRNHEVILNLGRYTPWPQWEAHVNLAREVEALPVKSEQTVNEARVNNGYPPIALSCEVCESKCQRLVIVENNETSGDSIDICENCLIEALGMLKGEK